MRTLYLLVQQLTGIHRKALETEDIMSDMTDQGRSTGHTAILRLEKSFTAKQEMLGERPICLATVLCFLHNCPETECSVPRKSRHSECNSCRNTDVC